MHGIHVFLNGDRGLPVVDALHDGGHRVDSIVVPEGRTVAGLRERCGARKIRVEDVRDVNDPGFLDRVRGTDPSLFVVAGFSTIFKPALIGLPRLGTINLHAGPLPRYRGGSPLNWQLINGESSAGISVIRMDAGIDSGPVLAEASFPIRSSDTIADLHGEANRRFPPLVLDAVAMLERDTAAGRAQDDAAACYWHQRSDADGKLDVARLSAAAADRMVRALTRPYPGAFFHADGRKVRVFAARIPDLVLRGAPGRICWIEGRGPYLVCADRAVLVTDYLIEGEPAQRLRHGEYVK
jgi:methionyl-tRNA formyltransferase